jgi:hypothetical protein
MPDNSKCPSDFERSESMMVIMSFALSCSNTIVCSGMPVIFPMMLNFLLLLLQAVSPDIAIKIKKSSFGLIKGILAHKHSSKQN